MKTTPTLRLGITMAGAVSAGAYTAGVMDYLLQTLQRWQQEKDKGNPLAPPHAVTIDVLGGTSAGGISAAIAAMSLYQGHEPITSPDTVPKQSNLLYDAWVNLVDDGNKDNSFLKMLDNSDIQAGGKIASLLNSGFIETIAGRALQHFQKKELPPYVSEDFELLLTLSNLRGVPMEINFNSDQEHRDQSPTHVMEFHKMYAHFKTNHGEDLGDSFFRLDFDNPADIARLLEHAKATAAFPIGLMPRQMRGMKRDFVIKSLEKFMNPALFENKLIRFREGLPDSYDFTAVDGGAFNNEPFVEMANLLEARSTDDDPVFSDFALLMIDPFPSWEDLVPDYKLQEHFPAVGGQLVSALRHQASFKEADILSIHKAGFKRNMIYPVRYLGPRKKAAGNAIACGALGGFSGFFKKEFRVHDYFLGRDNCRNFLQYIFSIRYPKPNGTVDKASFHPIHQDWTDDMIKTFGKDYKDALFLPVVPDFAKLDDNDKWKYWYHTVRAFPSIAPADLMALKDPIYNRSKAMIESFLAENPPPHATAARSISQADTLAKKAALFVGESFKPSFLRRNLGNLVQYMLSGQAVDYLATKATQHVLKSIVTDFAQKGLIKEEELGG